MSNPKAETPTSVAARLKAFRKSENQVKTEVDLEAIHQMTLEELELEHICFGQAMLGKSFPEAFEDGKWTDFFVSKYEKSENPAHRKYVEYVIKRLDKEINSKDPKKIPGKIIKKKSATKWRPSGSEDTASWTEVKAELTESDFEEAVPQSEMMENHVMQLQTDQQHMARRVTQMEQVLQEILVQVQKLSVSGSQ